MATNQEINDAVLLNDIINRRLRGDDTKKDATEWVRLGGQARYDELMADPQVRAYLEAGSGNSLVSTLKTAAPYVALGVGAYYAVGALAGGVAAPAAATTTATTTAATGGATFSSSLAAAQANTAALLSTAPVSSATLLASVSPTAGMIAAETAALTASNAAMFAAPLSDAAIFGLSTSGATSGAGIFSTLQNIKQGVDVGTIFQDISGTVADIGGTVADVYGSVLGTQVQLAQLDLAKAQAKAALNQPAPVFLDTAGGVDWKMIALVAAGVLGLAFVVKRFA